jgi:hypothetical protein
VSQDFFCKYCTCFRAVINIAPLRPLRDVETTLGNALIELIKKIRIIFSGLAWINVGDVEGGGHKDTPLRSCTSCSRPS